VNLINAKIEDLDDKQIMDFVNEIHHIRRQPRSGMLLHFIESSIKPWCEEEPFKKRPFSKTEVMLSHYLTRKLGDLYGTSLYSICIELQSIFAKGKSIEDYHRLRVYVFINRMIPKVIKAPKNRYDFTKKLSWKNHGN
jgi:hypothetical protein